MYYGILLALLVVYWLLDALISAHTLVEYEDGYYRTVPAEYSGLFDYIKQHFKTN